MIVSEKILSACAQQEEKSCRALYQLVSPYLMSICRRYSKDNDQAKFFLNSIFAKIIFNLKKYNREASFKLWIRKMAINHIIDELRKEKNYIRHLQQWDQNSPSRFTVSNLAELQLSYNDLLQTLSILPAASRDVFNLFIIDGYSHQEISAMLNISIGTSKWHVSHSRKLLRHWLESQNEQFEGDMPFFISKSSES